MVDSVQMLRWLRDLNVEVYFQKENIWTSRSEGGFLITHLSSLAQEESHSISQNMKVNLEEADVVCMTNLSAEIRLLIFCPDGTIWKMEFSLVQTCISVYSLK